MRGIMELEKTDIKDIRKEFRFLEERIYGSVPIYFDNAATTQKPRCVIDKIVEGYVKKNGNVHRGSHYLSNIMTREFEAAREKTAHFINAKSPQEIILTKGATEAVNLVASAYGRKYVSEGDRVLVGQGEHHSNYLPWQFLCRSQKAEFVTVPLTMEGIVDLNVLESLLTNRTKLFAIQYRSNVIGTTNDIKRIVELCHKKNVPVLVDGAQAAGHCKIDVQDLGCDFFCFSAHKMYGPNGVGILYGKKEILEQMDPYQLGGEMADEVGVKESSYKKLPYFFEAGTPNYVGMAALGSAIDFIESVGLDTIIREEKALTDYLKAEISSIKGIKMIDYSLGEGIVSFLLEGTESYDAALMLDKYGIAVRAGAHCAQPMMDFLKIKDTIRVSFGIYNTKEEVDSFLTALEKVSRIFQGVG